MLVIDRFDHIRQETDMIFDFFSIPIKLASSCLLMSLYIREQSIGQETKLFESGVPEIPWDGADHDGRARRRRER
jgi:hypothetical protein